MLDQVPSSVNLLFILVTFCTYVMVLLAFLRALDSRVKGQTHLVALLLLMWLIFQSTLSINRWYMDREAMPPHLMFPLITSLLVTGSLFAIPFGRRVLQALHPGTLVILHVIRIPVEITLYLLASWKQVPWSMTFEGYNLDILSGITAPLIWWFGYKRKLLSRRVLIAWNVGALILLIVVVSIGIGALPSPVQRWDFSQPNYAVMHFPFSWLPSFVVPVVAFSHVVLLFQLFSNKPAIRK